MDQLDETIAAIDHLSSLLEASPEKEARLAAHRAKMAREKAAGGPKTNVKGGPAEVRKALKAGEPAEGPVGGRKEGKHAKRQALLYPGMPAKRRQFGVRGLAQDQEQQRAADTKAREAAKDEKHTEVMRQRAARTKARIMAEREAKRKAGFQAAMAKKRETSLAQKIEKLGGEGPRPIPRENADSFSPKERWKAQSTATRFWSGSKTKVKERQDKVQDARYDRKDRAERKDIEKWKAAEAKRKSESSRRVSAPKRSPDAKPLSPVQKQERAAARAAQYDDWEPGERARGKASKWGESTNMNTNLVEVYQTRTLPALMEAQGFSEERNETTFKSCAGKDEVKGGAMVATPHGRASIPQDRFAKQRPDGHSTYPTRPKCRASLAGVVRMAQYNGESLPLAKVNKLGGVKGGSRITAASKGSRDEKHRGPSGTPKRDPKYGQPTGKKDKSLHTKKSEHGRAGNREITPVAGHAAKKPGKPMSGRKQGRHAAGVKVGVERSRQERRASDAQARQER